MPQFALPIAIAASSIGGALLSGRGRTITTQQKFDTTAQGLRGQLGGLLSEKLNQPLSIDPALLSQGLGGLNKLFASGTTGLQNQFSSRGLGQSGLFGGSLSNLELARMGKAGDLLNQLMGTATERQNMTINQALQLASPTGQVQNQPGSLSAGFGGGLSDLGSTLGLLAALGKLGGGSTGAPASSAGSSMFAPLFSGGGF